MTTITDEELATFRQALEVVSKDRPSQAELAQLARACDSLPRVYRFAGNLMQQATLQLTNQNAAITLTEGHRQVIGRYVQQLRRDLGYDNAPALERLLIEQIVLTWLRLGLAEQHLTSVQGRGSLDQLRFYEQKLSACQSRHLRAIESLARVRKLGVTLQVNVNLPGGQQLNAQG